MNTLTSALVACDHRLHLDTAYPTEFIDITEQLEALLARTSVRRGIANVQSLHTTTAVVVNEQEPLLLLDFGTLLERMAAIDGRYRHDDSLARLGNLLAGERQNGHAHCRALLLGTSVGLNVVDGRLQLGRWQRVFFVELDGPQPRDVSIVILGESNP